MKKLFALLTTVVLAMCLTFSACNIYITDASIPVKGTVTFVIAAEETTEYTADLTKVKDAKNAFAVLQYVVTENSLSMDCSFNGYGAFINGLGKIEKDKDGKNDYRNYLNPKAGTNEYILVCTSVEKDFDVSGSMGDGIVYKNKTLKPSGLGISSMSLEDGAIVYFTISVYEM